MTALGGQRSTRQDPEISTDRSGARPGSADRRRRCRLTTAINENFRPLLTPPPESRATPARSAGIGGPTPRRGWRSSSPLPPASLAQSGASRRCVKGEAVAEHLPAARAGDVDLPPSAPTTRRWRWPRADAADRRSGPVWSAARLDGRRPASRPGELAGRSTVARPGNAEPPGRNLRGSEPGGSGSSMQRGRLRPAASPRR